MSLHLSPLRVYRRVSLHSQVIREVSIHLPLLRAIRIVSLHPTWLWIIARRHPPPQTNRHLPHHGYTHHTTLPFHPTLLHDLFPPPHSRPLELYVTSHVLEGPSSYRVATFAQGVEDLVKVINEVIKGLGRVAAYLDDVIVFDPDPTAHGIRAMMWLTRSSLHFGSPNK